MERTTDGRMLKGFVNTVYIIQSMRVILSACEREGEKQCHHLPVLERKFKPTILYIFTISCVHMSKGTVLCHHTVCDEALLHTLEILIVYTAISLAVNLYKHGDDFPFNSIVEKKDEVLEDV
jgi:hypothetical protein